MDFMAGMRSSGASATSVGLVIFLSCPVRTRRVKEACQILLLMLKGEEGEVEKAAAVLFTLSRSLVFYSTGRFGRGRKKG